jgi:arylsulfatase A-like enzyme
MVTQGAPSPHETIYWQFRHQTAVRRGPWKLVLEGWHWEDGPVDDAVRLTNLETDIGEEHNLRDQEPELTAELTAAALRWRAAVGPDTPET